MTTSTVKITNAHKYYNRGKGNELHVMDNINLELPESGMIAVFGKSGCGKTTLLNAIGGLDKIASGKIELFGADIRQDTDTLRNKYIGYIFQNYNLNVSDTVFENVAAALRLCGMEDEREITERVMAALTNVDMAKYRDRTPDTLSGGQQQRVAIARALVKNPAIILADEPTGNLDENNTVLVMDILKEISRTHLVILVTHEANLVDYYCDRVIEIVDGRIVGERVNREANGYVQRNKNDIYLGELTRTETETPGVRIEYYGEPAEEICLRVVSAGGKLYLKCDTPSVKFLDEGAEVKLREGVFEENVASKNRVNSPHLDMSRLTPIEGKHFGRLYHWKNAFISAWRENFSTKQKKGKKLLRVCLVLLAFVMVFMTAVIGTDIREYTTLRETHNYSEFFIPLSPDTDYSAISADMGTHGMDFARIVGSWPIYDFDTLNFSTSTFMTAEKITLRAEGLRAMDVAHAADLPLVAGSRKTDGIGDILITTAVADLLLESSTVEYIDSYKDLVGLINNNSWFTRGRKNLRIVGVVQSDELYFYMPSMTFTHYVLDNFFWLPIAPASEAGMTEGLRDGEAVFIRNSIGNADLHVGDKITVLGKTFVVSSVVETFAGIGDYPAYVRNTYGVTIKDAQTYIAERQAEDSDLTAFEAEYEWLLDYYHTYIPAFYGTVISSRQGYEDITFEEWAIAEKDHIASYAQVMNYDPEMVCAVYAYHAEKGSYPTEEELSAYLMSEAVQETVQAMVDNSGLYGEYDRFMQTHYKSGNEYCYIISDSDWISLAAGAGKTDSHLGMSTYDVYNPNTEYCHYSNHLLVHSTDPAATEAYLTAAFGDSVITPDEIFEEKLSEIRVTVLMEAVSILVVLVLMCLCVFFIMRSSFMSRVREVGILRAIGVTKKNLVFRFAVETALLIALTLLVGYLLSAWCIASLADAALFSSLFYFPFWLALGLLLVICAASMLFGVLPAILLLRRTPSEILSKYDI